MDVRRARAILLLVASSVVPGLVYSGSGAVVSATTHDAWIAGEIEGRLRVQSQLDVEAIDIVVERGVVTLHGVIESELDRDLALDVARQVDGVRRVRDRLSIGAPAEGRP
jgi:hyperosmotically inducible periplasmic protein